MAVAQPVLDRNHPRFGEVYLTMISHVISGEAVGVEHYAQMVPLARSLDERLHLLEDAWSEKGHLQSMQAVCRELGIVPDFSIGDDYWGKVRSAFRARAVEGDLAACYVMQDVVIECLAVTFYEALVPGLDPSVGKRLTAIAADEREHLASGTETVRAFFREDPQGLEQAVEYANEHTGRVLAEWMRSSDCQPVCGVCSSTRGSCFKEDLTLLDVDIAATRGRFTSLYGAVLRDVGFAPAKVTRWLARLAV
jgi:fatty aldehyde decarbonylase